MINKQKVGRILGKQIVIANWKMNPVSTEEAKKLFFLNKKWINDLKNTRVVVCPPVIYLNQLNKLNNVKNLYLGVQNIANKEKGSQTGETSVLMAKDAGATYSIVGHSERREMGEKSGLIREKILLSLLNKITPIVCVGEQKRDIEGHYLNFIKEDIKNIFTGLDKKDLLDICIAYEPVWAIGAPTAMDPTSIHEMVLFIRKVIGELFGQNIANGVKILYGGAVDKGNVLDIIKIGNVDGFIIGRSSISLDFGELLKIIESKK